VIGLHFIEQRCVIAGDAAVKLKNIALIIIIVIPEGGEAPYGYEPGMTDHPVATCFGYGHQYQKGRATEEPSLCRRKFFPEGCFQQTGYNCPEEQQELNGADEVIMKDD
jgi:hypothetical protein